MCRKPHRLHPTCYVGLQRYFLTFCTRDRRKVFTNAAVVALVREQILQSARDRGFAVLAYVFMHDHIHLLIEAKAEDADMKSFADLAKQKSGYAYSRRFRMPLWHPSYWDRVLREEEGTWDVIRYICDNPLRKGLVKRCEDYPFLGSAVMTRAELIAELGLHPWSTWCS